VHKFYVISPYRRVGIISRSFAFVRRFLASNPTCCRYSESFSSKITSISTPVPLSFPFPFVSVVPSTSRNPISYLRHQVLPSSPHLILAPRSPCISIRRLSLSSPQMYYDPYPPRTGPAAMPSPRSKIAPYFSGRRGTFACTFEDFLEEFEARAYDCRLTDPQRVNILISYVDPSFREMCKSLNGYRSCDWSLFRHSLINTFGSITPRYQAMKQKLRDFVEDSSRMRMDREDDVLQYYRTFQHYSDPLIHSSYLTEKDRDIEFWYGFHPHDRDNLWPRLLAMYPFHPHNIPFDSESVFDCACRAFAYEERLSFWARDQEYERRSLSRRNPSPSYTSDPRPFPSFSELFSESQHTPAPSVMKVQPEPEPEPEFMHSITPTSPSAPSLAFSCTNDVPESELEPISSTQNSPPLLPSSTSASSCTNVVPESVVESILIIPTPISLPPTTSLATSCTDAVPEPESISEHAFSSVFPSTSPVLSIPSIPASCTDAVAEPELMPLHDAPSLSFANSSMDLECLLSPAQSATEVRLPELAPLLISTSPALPLPTSFVSPNLVNFPETAFVHESEPASTSLLDLDQSPQALTLCPDHFCAPLSSPSNSSSEPLSQPSASCEPEPTLSSAADLVLLSLSEPSSESHEIIPIPHSPESPLEVPNVPVLTHSTSQAKSQERTLEVTSHEVTPEVTSTPPLRASAFEVPPSLSDRSHASPSRPLPTVEISSSRFGPQSSLGEIVPIVPALSLERSLNVPAPPHSTPPQRPLGVTLVDPRSSLLDLILAPVSLTPSQEGSLDNEVSSAPAPRPSFAMHLPHSSSSSSIDVNFAFTFVTHTVLVSALFVVSAVIPTHSRKSWAKNEDINSKDWNRDSTTMQGNAFDLTQRLRHAQYTARPARLIFDPGGLVSYHHHTKMLANACGRLTPRRGHYRQRSLPIFLTSF
jgi:hypothetical protein